MMSNPTTTPFASLDALVRGFDDPVHDAQTCFRVLLDALSRPGTVHSIDVALDDQALRQWPAAAYAALLTVADFSTPIWLARQDDALAQAIRFHTDAPLAEAPDAAAFVYVDDAASLPAPDVFALGTPEVPQASATLWIRVDALEGGRPLTLTGPGIETSARVAPLGIDDSFWRARAALAAIAPCGIDCYLVCGRSVMGIPRTTRVELN
jgi:alpha-D-ribose 1-methylphosphonate 5-triphosphate synthase subunit PhnH